MPRHNIRVSRLQLGHFLVDFKMSLEHDHALRKSFIEIGGSVLPLWPWRSASGTVRCTWWYHVKVIMEDVPLEASNEDGLKSIMGDVYILDTLDSRTTDNEHESSEFLSYWVWMEDLPRLVGYSIFAAGVVQVVDINGLPSPTCLPLTPPKGKIAEKGILVHFARYEDSSPKTLGG